MTRSMLEVQNIVFHVILCCIPLGCYQALCSEEVCIEAAVLWWNKLQQVVQVAELLRCQLYPFWILDGQWKKLLKQFRRTMS